MDVALLGLQAGHFGAELQRCERRLRADPDVETIGREFHRRVQRLHRRVREMRHLIGRFDDLAGLRERARRIAVLADVDQRLVQAVAIELLHLSGVGCPRPRRSPR